MESTVESFDIFLKWYWGKNREGLGVVAGCDVGKWGSKGDENDSALPAIVLHPFFQHAFTHNGLHNCKNVTRNTKL